MLTTAQKARRVAAFSIVYAATCGFMMYSTSCEGRQSTFIAWPRTNGPEIHFQIDHASMRVLDSVDVNTSATRYQDRVDAIIDSATYWNNAGGTNIRYVYDGDVTSHGNGVWTAIYDCLDPNAHQSLVYATDANNASIPIDDGVLAQTVISWCGDAVRGFTIELYDTGGVWSSPEPRTSNNVAEMRNYVTHEFGHALGLMHLRAPDNQPILPEEIPFLDLVAGGQGDPHCDYKNNDYALMCKYANGHGLYNIVESRGPQKDDLQGVALMYQPLSPTLAYFNEDDPIQGKCTGDVEDVCSWWFGEKVSPVTNPAVAVTVGIVSSILDGDNIDAGYREHFSQFRFTSPSDTIQLAVFYNKHIFTDDEAWCGVLINGQFITTLGLDVDNIAAVRQALDMNVPDNPALAAASVVASTLLGCPLGSAGWYLDRCRSSIP